MELNARSPFICDWENLVVIPSRAVEVSKKFPLIDSEFDTINGLEVGSFHSSGGGSGCYASDLAYGSSSKTSKSASVDSSTNRKIRDSMFIETSHGSSQDLSCRKEAIAWPTQTLSATEISIGSGNTLIGLKLGKRTYFEDVSGGSNSSKASALSPTLSDATLKRSKPSSQSAEIPRCQVEGCNLDLSSAKDYHRKHRVCEMHSKSSKVIICGLERRFCQQCSRFHGLSEFDQKKRSCRSRLSDHNARRRKPKSEIIRFNSMRLHSSLHEGRNQISLSFNQGPFLQTRSSSSSTWDFRNNSKLIQGKLGLFSPMKTGGNELHIMHNEPQETGFKLTYGGTQPLPSNEAPLEVFHQGLQVSTTTNNMDVAQDLRALSLLSTNSWGSCEPNPAPPAPDQSRMLRHHHMNNQFEAFQLLNEPKQSYFFSY